MTVPVAPTLFLSLAIQGARTPAPVEIHQATETPRATGAAPIGSQATLHWADANGDGHQDVLAISPEGELQLLVNQGDATFVDVTRESGLDDLGVVRFARWEPEGAGAAPDLLVGLEGSATRLFDNRGQAFVDVTVDSGLGAHEDLAAHWIDVNGDGLSDLHRTGAEGHAIFLQVWAGVFTEVPLPLFEHAAPTLVTPIQVADPSQEESTSIEAPTSQQGGMSQLTGQTVPQGPTGPDELAGLQHCLKSLEDQSGGACVQASRTATLGMLYPLSSDLFVDAATGNVGVGTISPAYTLEVAGQIVSGSGNSATGSDSAMGGGASNSASGDQSTVAGGESNSATGQGAFIGGGLSNLALSQRAAIAGGVGNRAGYRSFVGGGDTNAALGNLSTVAGGKDNEAQLEGAAVGGGVLNVASATHAAIAGGLSNTASGVAAVVGGGQANLASGGYGAVPGGRQNVAAGAYSMAAGRRAQALHDGAFLWADSTDADFTSTAPNQFAVRAAGGMGVGRIPEAAYQLDVEGIVRASDTIVSTKSVGAPFSVASTDANANLNADLLDGFHASAFSQLGTTIETLELADDAVTAAKVAAGAVGTDELADGAVTGAKIATGAIGSSAIADFGVTGPKLAIGAVTASKIALGSVNTLALSTGAVHTEDILDAAVSLPKLDSSAGSQGQVLGHDGASVAWTTLPNSAWTPIDSLPYVISTPGTYYLTANLTGVSGASGIEVTTDDGVTIDLNGFSIQGVPGSQDGIDASSADNVHVRNGTVQGWGGSGLQLNNNGTAHRVLFLSNAFYGVFCLGAGQSFSECVSRDNGESGFVFSNATVRDCRAIGNVKDGFNGNGSLTNCVALSNADGFQATGNLRDCRAVANSGFGFLVTYGVIVGCTAQGNGVGIWGLSCHIEGNLVALNDIGIRAASGSQSVIVRNAAYFSGTANYDIDSNDNAYGEIVSVSSGVITSANAFANFDG